MYVLGFQFFSPTTAFADVFNSVMLYVVFGHAWLLCCKFVLSHMVPTFKGIGTYGTVKASRRVHTALTAFGSAGTFAIGCLLADMHFFALAFALEGLVSGLLSCRFLLAEHVAGLLFRLNVIDRNWSR